MIDLECLASFVAVAEAGSFGAAAAQRGLSQSGVSQHLSRLEAAVGARLIERGRRVSLPSEAGQRLLPYARELLALAQRAREAVHSPRLAIGASGNIATSLLPGLLGRFAASVEGRDVVVGVSAHPNPEVLHRLGRRLIDLALTEWAPVDPAFHALAWRHEPLGIIVPPGHPLARASSVSIDKLAGEPMIGGEHGSGTATLLREAFGAAADRLRVQHAFGSTEGVKRAVMAGLGVSIVMRAAVQGELARGELAWLEFDGCRLEKPLHLVCRADGIDDARIARFARFLTSASAAAPEASDQASRPAR